MGLICRAAIAICVLISLSAPAMACALPGSRMSTSERECCQRMQGECGAMNMPASHSCCHRSMGPVHVDFAPAQIVSQSAGPNLLITPLSLASPQISKLDLQMAAQPNDSPPRISRLSSSILRI
ncbi:MAG TPA: hypothetical protein VLI55_17390 [Bryobacteraceae bacterium]|nr:hypothetical protein [Bryobacteraceae bacterium]